MTNPNPQETIETLRARAVGWASSYNRLDRDRLRLAKVLIDDCLTLLKAQQWISVEDELPRPNQKETNDVLYLVWHNNDYDFAFFDGPESWDSPDNGWIKPSHWTRALPAPPQESGE
jgi:hypothetical protein